MSDLSDREKLRNSERRRVEHAVDVLQEMFKKHMRIDISERHVQELYVMKTQLLLLIQNQHIKDADYAEYKSKRSFLPPSGGY